MEAASPASDIRVRARLVVGDGGQVWATPYTDPVSFTGLRTFDLTAPASAQDISIDEDATMQLSVEARGIFIVGPHASGLTLEPGGTMTLPLGEFRDPLLLEGIAKPLDVPDHVAINPGETRQIVISAPDLPLSNVEFLATRDWLALAHEPGSDAILAVRAPLTAEDGETLDVALWGDAQGLHLGGLRIEVDTDEDHPNERTPETDRLFADGKHGKASPALPPVALVAACVALVLLRRR